MDDYVTAFNLCFFFQLVQASQSNTTIKLETSSRAQASLSNSVKQEELSGVNEDIFVPVNPLRAAKEDPRYYPTPVKYEEQVRPLASLSL